MSSILLNFSIPQFSILIIFFLFLLSQSYAQPSPDPQNPYNQNINPSIGIVVIALVVSLFLLGFFSMYIRHCADSSSPTDTAASNAIAARSRPASRGLDAAVINSFPTFDYSSIKSLHFGKGALECAVCLNEFEDDETLRLIPKCDHVFHPDCIDAWLVSHTTCPVCRADLTPQSDDAPQLDEAQQAHQPGPITDSLIDIMPDPVHCEPESMERPLNPAALPPLAPNLSLNRSRTHKHASGRPKLLGMFARSNSTGHVAVKQWENMERFTLRLPEEVRRQIMSGSLERTTSSRRGPRVGPTGSRPVGEGSSRGRRFGSLRMDRAARSDRWVFSLAPPFVSRAPSVRSPKVAAASGSVRSSKPADHSLHVFTVADANLPQL